MHVMMWSTNAKRMLLSLAAASNGGEEAMVVTWRQMEVMQEQRLLPSKVYFPVPAEPSMHADSELGRFRSAGTSYSVQKMDDSYI